MLKIDHLQAGYGESMILRDVTLKIEPGQVVCLMGRNGVGKTTLMKSIMGLLRPKQGTIECHNQRITSYPTDRRAKMGIGYVPQGRDIFSSLTIEENLLLGLEATNPRIKTIPDSVFTMFPVFKRNREVAILLVEQSLAFATTIADYYYVLDRGTIVAEGSAADLSEEQVKQHLTV